MFIKIMIKAKEVYEPSYIHYVNLEHVCSVTRVITTVYEHKYVSREEKEMNLLNNVSPVEHRYSFEHQNIIRTIDGEAYEINDSEYDKLAAYIDKYRATDLWKVD